MVMVMVMVTRLWCFYGTGFDTGEREGYCTGGGICDMLNFGVGLFFSVFSFMK